MSWVALAVISAWLLVVSFVLAGLVRHVATIQLAGQAGPLPLRPYDFEADGPEVGMVVPTEVADVLLDHGRSPESEQVLFVFSPGCGTCLEVADKVAHQPSFAGVSLFLVLGPTTGGEAAEIRALLAPTGAPLIDGDPARSTMRALKINSVPFAVCIGKGRVVRKRFLRQNANFDDLFPPASLEAGPREV